jgi:hypothetical protein
MICARKYTPGTAPSLARRGHLTDKDGEGLVRRTVLALTALVQTVKPLERSAMR